MSDTLRQKKKIILYVTMQTEQFCIQESFHAVPQVSVKIYLSPDHWLPSI